MIYRIRHDVYRYVQYAYLSSLTARAIQTDRTARLLAQKLNKVREGWIPCSFSHTIGVTDFLPRETYCVILPDSAYIKQSERTRIAMRHLDAAKWVAMTMAKSIVPKGEEYILQLKRERNESSR